MPIRPQPSSAGPSPRGRVLTLMIMTLLVPSSFLVPRKESTRGSKDRPKWGGRLGQTGSERAGEQSRAERVQGLPPESKFTRHRFDLACLVLFSYTPLSLPILPKRPSSPPHFPVILQPMLVDGAACSVPLASTPSRSSRSAQTGRCSSRPPSRRGSRTRTNSSPPS